MIDLLRKELSIHGISFKEGHIYYGNKVSSFQEIEKQLAERKEKNTKLIRRLASELVEELKNPTSGLADKKTRRMFCYAIKSLYDIFIECRCSIQNLRSVKDILNSDSGIFSSKFMSKVIDFNMGIQWLLHLIRRDAYAIFLMKKYIERVNSKRESFARGFSGPWGRLDLPMEERVFEWGDVAEETAGRQADKMKQRRYRMGLENTKDNSPNEGFYWREIRNEPFAWGDEDSNPYPHRNTLWRS